MPRYGRVPKNDIPSDPVYNSLLVQKFINKLMMGGKKSKAETIVYGALVELKKKLNQDPLTAFQKALDNITPLVEVKARRVGGATYQVPIEVPKMRGQAIAFQWLRRAARERKGRSMIENLAAELADAFNGTGGATKMREDLHKTAEANKAFAHFRW